jgi:hypothetical protein
MFKPTLFMLGNLMQLSYWADQGSLQEIQYSRFCFSSLALRLSKTVYLETVVSSKDVAMSSVESTVKCRIK